MLRLQSERMDQGLIPNLGEYGNRFGLTDVRAQRLQSSAVVMHPGPMNRGVEMHVDPADLPNSLIHKQVANGVSVRMAVLFDVLARGAEVSSLKEEGVA
jgi:aspartate carbamoyltransferase catalytic subunit